MIFFFLFLYWLLNATIIDLAKTRKCYNHEFWSYLFIINLSYQEKPNQEDRTTVTIFRQSLLGFFFSCSQCRVRQDFYRLFLKFKILLIIIVYLVVNYQSYFYCSQFIFIYFPLSFFFLFLFFLTQIHYFPVVSFKPKL